MFADDILGPVKQWGFLVKDLDQAMASWVDQLGVGPWWGYRNVPAQAVVDGESSDIVMSVGLAYHQGVQVEPLLRGSTRACSDTANCSEGTSRPQATSRATLHTPIRPWYRFIIMPESSYCRVVFTTIKQAAQLAPAKAENSITDCYSICPLWTCAYGPE